MEKNWKMKNWLFQIFFRDVKIQNGKNFELNSIVIFQNEWISEKKFCFALFQITFQIRFFSSVFVSSQNFPNRFFYSNSFNQKLLCFFLFDKLIPEFKTFFFVQTMCQKEKNFFPTPIYTHFNAFLPLDHNNP